MAEGVNYLNWRLLGTVTYDYMPGVHFTLNKQMKHVAARYRFMVTLVVLVSLIVCI